MNITKDSLPHFFSSVFFLIAHSEGDSVQLNSSALGHQFYTVVVDIYK